MTSVVINNDGQILSNGVLLVILDLGTSILNWLDWLILILAVYKYSFCFAPCMLAVSCFLIDYHFDGMRWKRNVISICMSLTSSEVKTFSCVYRQLLLLVQRNAIVLASFMSS